MIQSFKMVPAAVLLGVKHSEIQPGMRTLALCKCKVFN